MSLLSADQLNARAKKHCQFTMQELMDAPLQMTPEDESTEWDPLIRRHLFEKTLVVWHPCDSVEMIVDAAGRVVAFRDLNRAEPKTPPPLVPLEASEVLKIAGTSGWLGPRATVDSLVIGMKNMLVATITQEDQGLPACIEFTINPDARHVAAFKVIKF